MKLSDYIAGLQKFLEKHGDLECYYARDDEGNGYQQVAYSGTLYHRLKQDDTHRPELIGDEDEDYGETDKDVDRCF